MDAGGWPGLGWWCWLRKGPGRRRAGTQQQQQAAFEGGHTYMRSAWSRPRSPMKDKPTTRRPPAGLGMDDPDPLGSGAALASPGAHAGPPYARIQCDSVRFTAHCAGAKRPPRSCQTMLPARTSPGFVPCLVGIEVVSVRPPENPPCARRNVPSDSENSVLPRRAHLAPPVE